MKGERSPKRKRACSSARRRGRRPQRNKTRFFVVVGGVQVASFLSFVCDVIAHSRDAACDAALTQIRDVWMAVIDLPQMLSEPWGSSLLAMAATALYSKHSAAEKVTMTSLPAFSFEQIVIEAILKDFDQ